MIRIRGHVLISSVWLAAAAVALGVGAAAHAQQSQSARPLLLDPSNPEWSRPSPAIWYARFETSKGDFVVRCVRAHAPNGSDRFYNLIRLGYYDDVRFHRAVPQYIAQWGLHGDPAVNRAWLNAAFEDDPKYGSNLRGTFAFARDTVPGTANTQIYVNLRDNIRNDRDPFAIFGRVISGMEVLDSLYSGYGNGSGGGVRQRRQGKIVEGGNAYLDREFPRLDRLIRAELIREPAGRGGAAGPAGRSYAPRNTPAGSVRSARRAGIRQAPTAVASTVAHAMP